MDNKKLLAFVLTLFALLVISILILVTALSSGTPLYNSHLEEKYVAETSTVEHDYIDYGNGTIEEAWTETVTTFVKQNVTVNDDLIGFQYPNGTTIYPDIIIINSTSVSVFDVPIGDRSVMGCLDYEINKGVCEVVYQE